MFSKKSYIFSLVLLCFNCLFLSCETKEQKKLNALLDTKIFTDAKGECSEIIKNISDNSDEFLADLNSVLLSDTIDMFTIADKKHFLSANFVPKDLIELKKNNLYYLNKSGMYLRAPIEQKLQIMAKAAQKDGLTLLVGSAYRSYDYQKTIYERNVRQMGKIAADRVSAAPGTSQHQLGTVMDFGSISDEFADTKEGIWLSKNAAKYGFSLSFPKGYEKVTGYQWECWHYRYVGLEAIKFQQKWFKDIQQYMIEFLYAWK